MIWALGAVDDRVERGAVAYLVAALLGATLFVAALITMIGASAFMLVKSRYLYTVLFGFFELCATR